MTISSWAFRSSSMSANFRSCGGASISLEPSTIALKRKVLEEIGGFKAFAGFLADDYEIGRAVRAKGHRVAISRFTVLHACNE